jgi:hypothetical protein
MKGLVSREVVAKRKIEMSQVIFALKVGRSETFGWFRTEGPSSPVPGSRRRLQADANGSEKRIGLIPPVSTLRQGMTLPERGTGGTKNVS